MEFGLGDVKTLFFRCSFKTFLTPLYRRHLEIQKEPHVDLEFSYAEAAVKD